MTLGGTAKQFTILEENHDFLSKVIFFLLTHSKIDQNGMQLILLERFIFQKMGKILFTENAYQECFALSL